MRFESRWTYAYTQMTNALVADFDLVTFFDTSTHHAACVTGAQAAALLLVDESGELQVKAASNRVGADLGSAQVETGEGPGPDCLQQHAPIFTVDDEQDPSMWPTFAAAMEAAGVRSAHAYPVRLRKDVIGVLNIFGTSALTADPDEVRLVQALADLVGLAVLHERAVGHEVLVRQLEEALVTRGVLEQAKGVISCHLDIDVEEAFQIMRRRARKERRRVHDVAQEVIDSRQLMRPRADPQRP